MIINIGLIIVGFVLLIKGADFLVDGASNIAKRLRIPQIIVGLTIVSIGTSLPELMVSLKSSLEGLSDISLSNVIGSNLCNLLLILGLASIIRPVMFKKETKYAEIPIAILSSVILLILGNKIFVDNNMISRIDGIILLVFFLGFIAYTIVQALTSKKNIEESEDEKARHTIINIVLILIGIVGLKFGGDFVVDNAVAISKMLGLSEKIIGLTIIAIGTSLPELVTSVVAASKGNSDIAIGNVLGSNIFNALWIVGLSATIKPLNYDVAFNIDLVLLTISTILLYTFTFGEPKDKMTRGNGIIYIAMYAMYMLFLFVR